MMGVLIAVENRQRYRSPLFGLLRQPLISALCLIAVHAVLFVLSAFFTVASTATVSERLDYALSNAGVASLAFAGEVLAAGLVAQVIATAFPLRWGGICLL